MISVSELLSDAVHDTPAENLRVEKQLRPALGVVRVVLAGLSAWTLAGLGASIWLFN